MLGIERHWTSSIHLFFSCCFWGYGKRMETLGNSDLRRKVNHRRRSAVRIVFDCSTRPMAGKDIRTAVSWVQTWWFVIYFCTWSLYRVYTEFVLETNLNLEPNYSNRAASMLMCLFVNILIRIDVGHPKSNAFQNKMQVGSLLFRFCPKKDKSGRMRRWKRSWHVHGKPNHGTCQMRRLRWDRLNDLNDSQWEAKRTNGLIKHVRRIR